MWVILDDGLKVQIGNKISTAHAGDEFIIPAEESHRIIAQGKEGRVLEIAFGYTDEDDIYRLEDNYGRKISPQGKEGK